VERWTRTGPTTLDYEVTAEDPTVWTRPWTVKQEFTKQNEQENRIYYEPRCVEGNYGLPGILRGTRIEDLAFAEGRGPDPTTRDHNQGRRGQPRPILYCNDKLKERPFPLLVTLAAAAATPAWGEVVAASIGPAGRRAARQRTSRACLTAQELRSRRQVGNAQKALGWFSFLRFETKCGEMNAENQGSCHCHGRYRGLGWSCGASWPQITS
jgi:hypothetical protein